MFYFQGCQHDHSLYELHSVLMLAWKILRAFFGSKRLKPMPSNPKQCTHYICSPASSFKHKAFHFSKIWLVWVINALLVLRSFKAFWHCSFPLAVSSFICWQILVNSFTCCSSDLCVQLTLWLALLSSTWTFPSKTPRFVTAVSHQTLTSPHFLSGASSSLSNGSFFAFSPFLVGSILWSSFSILCLFFTDLDKLMLFSRIPLSIYFCAPDLFVGNSTNSPDPFAMGSGSN